MATVAANIIARNEADRLKVLLPLIRPIFDEIVIVDQESTDDTVKVAKEYADTVINDIASGHCQTSRPLAAENTKSDWILVLDADEFINKKLSNDLRRLISNPIVDGYLLGRASIITDEYKLDDILDFTNHQHEYVHTSEPYVYRLFRKGRVEYPNWIHQILQPPHESILGRLYYNAIIDVKSHHERMANISRY